MALGEVFLEAFLQVLFDRLASRESLMFACNIGLGEKLEKWRKTFLIIQDVLDDAEEKQLTAKSVRRWLDDLRDLAYDVEDILDELNTEALERKFVQERQGSTGTVLNLIPTCLNPSSIELKLRMESKMEDITGRLQNTYDEIKTFSLISKCREAFTNVRQQPHTTSLLNELEVYGRGDDKRKIIELLLREDSSSPDANFQVTSIVGMGGLGKTTLAQLVYNDSQVVGHFNAKAWICVSDEFDVMRVTKAILETITSQSCEFKEFNVAQVRLRDVLAGKRFLLVLDDVWSKDYNLWELLKAPFMAGAPGSKIIVTTRDEQVALTIGSRDCYMLQTLTDNDCWSVFIRHAFGNKNNGTQFSSEIIREKVVGKCKGLPLAARTLGGLLRSKKRKEEWENILNSPIWNLPRESNILPVLRLSYYDLPSDLKRCFACCAVIPKDYEFEEEELVFLWMAEGLIPESKDGMQVEELGRTHFVELLSRSIFQASTNGKSRFIMHDLINDLAQWVVGETCFMLEDESKPNEQSKKLKNARHSSYFRGCYDGIKKFEAFYEAVHLRTFLPLSTMHDCYITSDVLHDLLPKLNKLWVLSLSGYNITEIPSSIGNLKLLRYLNLSFTKIRSLPKSTSSLYNLQIMLLKGCSKLRELPSEMENLINLCHLDVTSANLLRGMPLGMKELKCLRTLSNFIVGKDSGAGIEELMNLKSLKGRLHISSLESVTDAGDVRDANLKDKDIDILILEWGSEFNDSRDERNERDVLDGLQPHKNLEELTVNCYAGSGFPTWMGDPSFTKMVFLKVENCNKCTSLPPLGLLESLKELVVIGMGGLKTIDCEIYGENCSKSFPSLEVLHFEKMQEWKDWNHFEEVEVKERFPRLCELRLFDCPKLLGSLPSQLHKLEDLKISGCEQLVASISSFPFLCKLDIKNCKKVVCENLPKLCNLEIKGCEEVVFKINDEFNSVKYVILSDISKVTSSAEGGFMKALSRVEELEIESCKLQQLLSLRSWLASLQSLSFLHHLKIERCPELVSLGTEEEGAQLQFGLLCGIETISLSSCERLEKLPDVMNCLTSLRELHIQYCPKLTSIPRLPSSIKVLQIRSCANLRTLLDTEENIVRCGIEDLGIFDCPSLTSLSSAGKLPTSLLNLSIRGCDLWDCIVEAFEFDNNTSSLEILNITYCENLKSLSSTGNLPSSLQCLGIYHCKELESLGHTFHNNSFIETIAIKWCEKLKFLPEGLHNLRHLRLIELWDCPSMVFFPQGGLPTTNFRRLQIWNCEKLEVLPDAIHNLTSLQELSISDCPGIASFPKRGFPNSLKDLSVSNLKICKPLFEWGLRRFTSLIQLNIDGGCPDITCFPPLEIGMMLLPSSLTKLCIRNFPNLKQLSPLGFQNLTSLEFLDIAKCPKLISFPEKGLPLSLLQLYINDCPTLKQGCKRNTGREWSTIAHIPYIQIDGRLIYDPEYKE